MSGDPIEEAVGTVGAIAAAFEGMRAVNLALAKTVDNLAAQLVAAERALDATGAPPGDSMVARVEAMGDLVAESLALAVESADTHRALDEIGAPPRASPAERVRAAAAKLQPVVDGLHVAEKRLLQAANDLAAALGEDAPDTAGLGTVGLALVVAGLAARVRGGDR